MPDPRFSAIPTQEQLDALAAALQRVGLVAQKAARAMSGAFSNAAIQWQLAEARREENWHRKQRNDIRRQLLDRNPTYFGRKRRARRARGKWNIVWSPNCVPSGLAPFRHISVGCAGLPSKRRETGFRSDCHELDALAYLRQGQRLHQALHQALQESTDAPDQDRC